MFTGLVQPLGKVGRGRGWLAPRQVFLQAGHPGVDAPRSPGRVDCQCQQREATTVIGGTGRVFQPLPAVFERLSRLVGCQQRLCVQAL